MTARAEEVVLEALRPGPRSRFPLPLCATCARSGECLAAGVPFESYPACRRPLLGTRLDRQGELLAWCDRAQGGGDGRLAAVDGLLLDRFARDRWRFSEIFEPSASLDPSGWHLRRYSYAFPGYREDPGETRRFVASLARPFGPSLEAWFAATLARARDACVEQVLFGVAWESPSQWRLKLYVQFADSAPGNALGAAARILSHGTLRARFEGEPLHLLGIDVGPKGLGAVKLYFAGEAPGPPWLEGLGPLRKALRIYRLIPGQPIPAAPAEIDFPLAENDLTFDQVARLAPLAALVGAGGPLPALGREFQVAVRRISVSVPAPIKLTAYYVLAETDPP